jgi:hypothetical protein
MITTLAIYSQIWQTKIPKTGMSVFGWLNCSPVISLNQTSITETLMPRSSVDSEMEEMEAQAANAKNYGLGNWQEHQDPHKGWLQCYNHLLRPLQSCALIMVHSHLMLRHC